MPECAFCRANGTLQGEVLFESPRWFVVTSHDGELRDAVMMITERHITTPFEIDRDEWLELHEVLPQVKAIIDGRAPEGYNVGWNVGAVAGQTRAHAHLHMFARYGDEPLAGTGIRHAFKQPSNRRPGP